MTSSDQGPNDAPFFKIEIPEYRGSEKKKITESPRTIVIDRCETNNEKAKASTENSEKPKITFTTKKDAGIKIISRLPPRPWTAPTQNLSNYMKNKLNVKQILMHTNANLFRNKNFEGYSCSFCNKKFHVPQSLKKHAMAEHKSNVNMKYICSDTYRSSLNLDITELTCSICWKNLENLNETIEHLSEEHKVPFYKNIISELLPYKFHTNEYVCAVCDTKFATFKNLREHLNNHFRNYVCEVCSAGFVSKKSLRVHEMRHGSGGFECPECSKVFETNAKRTLHVKRVHTGEIKNRIRCQKCEEKFSDFRKLKRHLVKKHNEAPTIYPCKACEKTFTDQTGLTCHYRRDHLMERNFKCPLCNMKFFYPVSVKQHMVTHSNEKNFQCNECGKAYARKRTLAQHMRIHLDDRRFGCQLCGLAFIQKCSLKAHMRSKHGAND